MIDTLFMSCLVHKLHLSDYVPTVNQEIFVYENIHVLNIHVNKFSRVPHKNILTQKFCEVENTVHVSLNPVCLFILLHKKLNAVRSMQCVTHCNWQ